MTREQIEWSAEKYLQAWKYQKEAFVRGAESRQQEIDELVDKALRWDAEVGKQGKIILEQKAEIDKLVEALETAFSLLSMSNHTPHGTRKFMNEVTELLKQYDV